MRGRKDLFTSIQQHREMLIFYHETISRIKDRIYLDRNKMTLEFIWSLDKLWLDTWFTNLILKWKECFEILEWHHFNILILSWRTRLVFMQLIRQELWDNGLGETRLKLLSFIRVIWWKAKSMDYMFLIWLIELLLKKIYRN